jgi:hypothetical protein
VRLRKRAWGLQPDAVAVSAEDERRLRTRGLPEVAGIGALMKSEAKRDVREIEKASHSSPPRRAWAAGATRGREGRVVGYLGGPCCFYGG